MLRNKPTAAGKKTRQARPTARARKLSKPTADRALYRAIADDTRRAILDLLLASASTAGGIAARFAISRPAISRHLRLLRAAALVVETRDGRRRVYRATPEPLRVIDAWLARYRLFWSARLVELKEFVESQDPATEVSQSS